MEQVEIQIEPRVNLGSSNARRERRAGLVPAVVYEAGKASTALLLNEHSFRLAVRGCAPSQLFRFKSETLPELNGRLSLVKDVQIEPLKQSLLHVEFLALSEDHTVVVSVPLHLTGTPEAVKLGRALMNQTAYEIEVECLPNSIPDQFVLDVSGLIEGHSLHASDVALPPGTELVSNPDLTVATVLSEKKLSDALSIESSEQPAPVEAAPVAATAGTGSDKS